MASAARVLYVSYDGMTDPLGQSQVLPYVLGLTKAGYEFDLVTFEKPLRMKAVGAALLERLQHAGVHWHPLRYTKSPPILSTAWDVFRLVRKTRRLHKARRFDLVHCRSYVPALAGLDLKKRANVPFLFDMRGFWVDERVDGGLWNLANPIYRVLYHRTKRIEKNFLAAADGIVCLTHAGARLLQSHGGPDSRVAVIPCAVDFERFRPITDNDRQAARQKLGFSVDDVVFVYLGSIGTWYLLDEMLEFFATVRKTEGRARLLFITPDEPAAILERAWQHGIANEDLVLRSASYDEVPDLLAAANIGLCFIKPGASKAGSSPTKLGEYFAKGLPVIANAGVGDVDEIIRCSGGGLVLLALNASQYVQATARISELLELDPGQIRQHAHRLFDMRNALASYETVYRAVLEKAGA